MIDFVTATVKCNKFTCMCFPLQDSVQETPLGYCLLGSLVRGFKLGAQEAHVNFLLFFFINFSRGFPFLFARVPLPLRWAFSWEDRLNHEFHPRVDFHAAKKVTPVFPFLLKNGTSITQEHTSGMYCKNFLFTRPRLIARKIVPTGSGLWSS